MLATRVFLWLSALLWLPYGIYCFLDPSALAESAGVTAASPTATIELRAMYGGLQTALGLLVLIASFRRELERTALFTLVFLCAGLGIARLAGVMLAGELSSYTSFGLAFEWVSAGVAAWLLSRPAAESGAG